MFQLCHFEHALLTSPVSQSHWLSTASSAFVTLVRRGPPRLSSVTISQSQNLDEIANLTVSKSGQSMAFPYQDPQKHLTTLRTGSTVL